MDDEERVTRLQVLKAKRTASERTKDEKNSSQKPVLKFRNYNPQAEELKNKKLERTKPDAIETQVVDQIQSTTQPDITDDISLSKLAPKKAEWDLKRDIAKQLEKLERRTQRAIVEIIRDRLQEDSSDLASAVATVQQTSNNENYDSD